MTFNRFKSPLFIFLTAFVFTAVFTWPYILKLPTFYYDRGDFPVSGSILLYNFNSIISGRILNQQEYFNGYQFYPQPYTLAYSDPRLLPTLIFSPLYLLSKQFVLSVNLTAFISYILSFLSAFYTINYFLKNKLASTVGATVYAFNPLSFSRFPEHFELTQKYFLPLVFLYAYKFFNFPTLKNSFIFFLVFTLNAFSAIYFQIFSILLLPVFLLPFVFKNASMGLKYFINIFKYSLVLLLFLPVLLHLNSPYLDFSKQENVSRSLEDNTFFSARLIDFISSTKQNWLYGQITENIDPQRAPRDISGNFNYLEHTLSPNLLPVILFLAGIVYFWKTKKEKIILLSFGIVGLTAFVLTLGPYFFGWNGTTSETKMPFYYLYQILPFLKGIRAPTRFQFLFYIPFSVFIAFGAKFFLEKIVKLPFKIFLFTSILLLLFVENYNPEGMVVLYQEKSTVLPKVEGLLEGGKISYLQGKRTLHLPIHKEIGYDSAYLSWAGVTGEKVVNGNSGYLPGEQSLLLGSLNEGLNEEMVKRLVALNINYIVVHKDLFTSEFKEFELPPPSGIIFEDEDISIIDLQKYNFEIRRCDFEKDIEKSFQTAFISQIMRSVSVLVLKNKSDCYLANIYTDKYKDISIQSRDLYGGIVERKAQVKLPPIIGPLDEVILDEINGNLKVK